MGPTPAYGARAEKPLQNGDFVMKQTVTNICRLSGDINNHIIHHYYCSESLNTGRPILFTVRPTIPSAFRGRLRLVGVAWVKEVPPTSESFQRFVSHVRGAEIKQFRRWSAKIFIVSLFHCFSVSVFHCFISHVRALLGLHCNISQYFFKDRLFYFFSRRKISILFKYLFINTTSNIILVFRTVLNVLFMSYLCNKHKQ